MSSLASQLQSIASLDADRLTSRTGHPSSKSYLFPPTEAASHDLDAIFALGVSGFEEIVSLDPDFQIFEDELFSEHAKGVDRMLLNQEENRKLDHALERCLRRLGRWVGLMAGGKCLEWLVRRFRVHEMNSETVLQIFLPYHSSPNFARMLAILTIPKESVYHVPFAPLISKSQPIPRSYISDVISPEREKSLRLLSDIAGMLALAVKEHVAHRALLAFWTGIMVDLLDKTRTGKGANEGLVKILVETFAEVMSLNNGGKDVNAAVYPPLILLTRSVNLADEPFEVLLSSLLTPNSGAEPSQRLVTLLILLNDRKEWEGGVGQDGAQRLAKLDGLGQMLTAAVEKYDFSTALPVLFGTMVERLDLHKDHFAEIIDSGYLSDSLAKVLAAKILAVGSNASPDDKASATTLIATLRERHPQSVDAASLETENLDSALIARPDSETTMINLLSADVAARVDALTSLMAPHLSHPQQTPAEEADKLRTALVTRLSDTEAPILEVLYKTNQHKALIASVCPAQEVIEAIRPAFIADKLNLPVVSAHISFICNELYAAHPEAADDILREILCPVILPSQHRALSPEIAAVVKQSRLAKENALVRAVSQADLTSPFDVAAKLAESVAQTGNKKMPNFIIAQQDSTHPSSRLLAMLVCNHLISASKEPSTSLQVIQNLSKHLYGPSLQDVDHPTEPLSAKLSQAISIKPNAVRTTQRAIVGIFAALTNVVRPVNETFSLSASSTDYKSLAQHIYIWSNSGILPDELSKALLRSLFVQLGQDALVFFASIWTAGTQPAGMRVSALKHSVAFVNAHADLAGAGVDFQLILPALLIALQNSEKNVRAAGVTLLAAISAVSKGSDDVYVLDNIYGEHSNSVQLIKANDMRSYLDSLVQASEKILIDPQQIVNAHTAWLGGGSQNKKDANARRATIGALLSHVAAWHDVHARLALLKVLSGMQHQHLFRGCLPLLVAATKTEKAWLLEQDPSVKTTYLDALFRALDAKSASVLQEDNAQGWVFVKSLLSSDQSNSIIAHLRAASLASMVNGVFQAIPPPQKVEYVREILESLDVITTDDAFVTKGALAKLRLDPASIISLVDSLASGLEAPSHRKKQKQEETSQQSEKAISQLTNLIDSRDWKTVPANAHILTSLLGVLSSLLTRRQSVKEGIDYLEQEILAAVLAILERITDAAEVQRAHVGIEVIIKVIRASSNPRTSQRALLVASELARLIPESVLHNIMPIFTFMGASDLQRDDAYSFGVVEKTVQRIVPVMARSLRSKANGKLDLYRQSKTFITIFTDMASRLPRHRTLPFFVHLVKSLGADDYLAPISMLLVDRSTAKAGRGGSTSAQAMELAMGVAAAFDVDTKLEVVLEVVAEVSRLIEDMSKSDSEGREAFLASIDAENDRVLRQVTALLAFAQNIARSLVGKPCDQSLAEEVVRNLLLLASSAAQSKVSNSGVPAAVQSCMGTSMQLLSAQKFLAVVLTLINGESEQDITVALNILVERLPRVKSEIRVQNATTISDILKRCAALVGPNSNVNTPVVSALHSIASTAQKSEDAALASVVAPLVKRVTKLPEVSDQITTLSLLEVITRHLGSRVIPFIQSIVDVTLTISEHGASVARQAFALQSALMDVVPTFIGSKQLNAMLRHAFNGQDGSRDVVSSAAKKIPTKTAFPVVMDLWKTVQNESTTILTGFFELLRLVLKNADRAALPNLIKPIFAFFLDVFDLRHRLQLKGVPADAILAVESSSIGSFLELVTKLNEASFKPLFVRLYDWAAIDLSEGKRIDDGRLVERKTVLLQVMMGLLTKFKNILSPYIGTLQAHIEELLVAYQDGQITDEPFLLLLLDLLTKSFDVDDGAYWTDALHLQMIPLLVNLLDTPLTTSQEVKHRLATCIGALAGSTATEQVLKTLNTSICLSTRSDTVSTRLAALEALEAIWSRQAEELAIFVQETVGEFLSELVEDENGDVEVLARKVLAKIEEVTGDVKEYLD